MSLVDHFERYLGEIEAGWSRNADGDPVPFQVVRFPHGSGDGTISFATLGLGQYPMRSATGKEIRQELLMLVPDRLRDGPVPGLLQQIGMDILAARRPLLRGDVIGPRGPLIAGSGMEAVYVAIPVYFPDDFAVYEGDDAQIVVAWLVPISSNEAGYIQAHGWRAFEERLVEDDPDLTNVFRAPLAAI